MSDIIEAAFRRIDNADHEAQFKLRELMWETRIQAARIREKARYYRVRDAVFCRAEPMGYTMEQVEQSMGLMGR